MKRLMISLLAGILMTAPLWSQNPKLNPLNYSGKMYISSMEVLSTPRYVSYEDHAILSTDMSVPILEVTKIELDFKNNIITMQNEPSEIKNVSVKEYIDEYSTTVVIFMDLADSSDKMELVWPEEKSPYLLQITPQEDGAAICKMNLSQKPVVASEEDALIQLLNSLGGF